MRSRTTLLSFAVGLACAAVAAGAGLGCSSSRATGFSDAGPGGGFVDGGSTTLVTGDGGVKQARCPTETQYVHVIDKDGKLYRFDPPSATFTNTGTITCPGQVYSMAVDRDAFAWVLFGTGSIAHVDTRNAKCEMTGFVPFQKGFSATFGMGFSTDTPDGDTETLFVSDSASPVLAKIDTKTLTLTKVGSYDKLAARAELTGTGDARLFGAFEGTPYNVAEIDKASAAITSQAPQSAVNYPPSSSNFAFAFWGGDFYLFVGPGTSTDVFHYSPTTGQTTKIQTVSFVIVGAGVSTCAPTTPPK